MFTPSVLLYIVMLFISTGLVVCSSGWLGAWFGLEVNLMSFIPLSCSRISLNSVESALKYFLVQAFASLLYFCSILIVYSNFMVIWLEPAGLFCIVVALLIKLGAAPFHYWFPGVAAGFSWGSNFLLMTWQKLAPLVLLGYLCNLGYFLVVVILLSGVVGAVGGLNQSSLRKLMAYSSINHLGWLLCAVGCGMNYMLIYYILYMAGGAVLMYLLYSWGLYYVSQIYYYSTSYLHQGILFMNLFSFGGLPPFVGFFPKWMVISLLANSGYIFMGLIMVMMSLISLYYYSRLAYVFLSQSGVGIKTMKAYGHSSWWIYLLGLSLLGGLLFMPLFIGML